MAKAPSKRTHGENKEMVLNITSLIDVLTILLVFLLKSYSAEPEGAITISDQIKLPTTESALTVGENQTTVTVTKNAVLVDNKTQVAAIGANWKILGTTEDNPFKVDGLISALEEISEKKKYISENNPAFQFGGEIVIMADEKMPSRVLAAVLFSVGQAGFDKIKLLAISRNE